MEYPIKDLMDRYCFFRRKYVMMRGDMTTHMGSGFTSRQVWEHLNGNISLCVFSGPSSTTFMTVDVDLPDPGVVHKVVDTMAQLGLPRERIYVSLSGGKGYHVDLFFNKSMYVWKARELYELVIFFSGLDPHKVEFRPTPTQSIKLPLGVHQKTGKRCWFVDRETLEPIEDFLFIRRTEKVEWQLVDQVIKDGNLRKFYIMLDQAKESNGGERKTAKRGKKAGDSPYMITAEGTRHKMLILEALRLYREGGDYESIHHGLEEWLRRQDASLYKDPWDMCMRDIDKITGFVMRCGRRRELGDDPAHEFHENTRIYRSDVLRIIQGSTKASRLLAFLFTVFCDKYGFCGMNTRKLGETLGIRSNKTIVVAAKDLVDKGLFHKVAGGCRMIRGESRLVTNKYKFPKDYERGGEFVEIDGLVTEESVYDMYVSCVAQLCGDDDVAGKISKPEAEACREYRERMVVDAGTGERDDGERDGA